MDGGGQAGLVSLVVYAFNAGGAPLAAAYAASRTLAGMREGEAGDHFHVIVNGTAAVSVRGAPRPMLGAGDCFGEIALLRDIPRTATVTAEQPLRTLAFGREQFLTAITGNSASSVAVDALVAQRLAADPPEDSGGPAH